MFFLPLLLIRNPTVVSFSKVELLGVHRGTGGSDPFPEGSLSRQRIRGTSLESRKLSGLFRCVGGLNALRHPAFWESESSLLALLRPRRWFWKISKVRMVMRLGRHRCCAAKR